MARAFRVAYLGGSAFAASVAHGLAAVLPAAGFEAELALVDEDGGAAGAAAYVDLLARARGVALRPAVLPRAAALDGARLVLCAPTARQPALALGQLRQTCQAVGWVPPTDGPGAVAAAVAIGPFYLALACEVTRRCPRALLLTALGPADVLAGAARRRFGIAGLRAVGLSVEVEALRATLAHLLGTPEDEILLMHGGVGGVGWVVRFAVGGRDGYGEMGDRLRALAADPGLRPSERALPALYALTGMIRSSPSRVWPFQLEAEPAPEPDSTPPAETAFEAALSAALAGGAPLAEAPPAAEAHASPLLQPGAGRSVGRLVRAMATGEPAVVSLQVPYAGEVLGWSPEVTVEVPAVAAGDQIEPMAVGPLPAGVDGLPRLLGQQRALAADYLAHPDPGLLRRAFAVTPEWGRVDQMHRLAEALHAEFGAALEAASRA